MTAQFYALTISNVHSFNFPLRSTTGPGGWVTWIRNKYGDPRCEWLVQTVSADRRGFIEAVCCEADAAATFEKVMHSPNTEVRWRGLTIEQLETVGCL